MALIEILHVCADMFEVDPDWTAVDAIIEGEWVSLQTVSGNVYAERADGVHEVIGIAGDTMSDTTAGTPYAANVSVASNARQRSTQNRVSDYFNETLASGKITVYHSGGRFATDQLGNVTFAAGQPVYADANGNTTNVATAAGIVGIALGAAGAFPSGVPGTTIQGSMSLGTYLEFVMRCGH